MFDAWRLFSGVRESGRSRANPQKSSQNELDAILCPQSSATLLKSTSWRTMAIPLRLRTILLTTMRWTAAWAAIGLLIGIAMTLGRVPPIAEPGAPSGYAFYMFWIPVCLGAAGAFGLLLGLIFSSLLAAIGLWMPLVVAESGSFMSTYGWRMLCGAIAGGMIGFPLFDRNGFWCMGMGITSALVSGFMNRPKARSLAW